MKFEYRIAGIVVLFALLVAIRAWRNSKPPATQGQQSATTAPGPDSPSPSAAQARMSFSGDSTSLRNTVIVPTLDTPMPPGKNVVWCSSFQIAWNKLKNDVIKAPVLIKGAEAVAQRLNSAPQGEGDLSPQAYFAAAGFVKDGVCDQIRQSMAQKFPNAPAPRFESENLPPDLTPIVAYAYLAANVKFRAPFEDSASGLTFKDSAGTQTPVEAFGFESGSESRSRYQITVLWAGDANDATAGFVVDPCDSTQPNQIVLACITPKATLAETWADLQSKLKDPDVRRFARRPVVCMAVPTAAWRVNHYFNELIGTDKRLLNTGFEGYFIFNAQQDTEFRLDRTGAEVKSEAKLECKKSEAGKDEEPPPPLKLIFDRPFLVYMKKRGAEQPFFVMWVDNAELLTKR